MTLEAAFVRHRGRRDRIYVTRQDATTTSWDFPSYGDGLPHDLVHLVVETCLGIVDGFWGLVDGGVDVTLVDNEASLVRKGRPLVDEPGFDRSGLMKAEEAVAVIGATDVVTEPPGWVSPTTVAAIRARLADLGRRWHDLDDGGAITLAYRGGAMLDPMGASDPGPETALWVAGNGPRESNARRRRDVVLRTAGPWSATTMALLRHLEDVGFPGAPRVVGNGFAEGGRETVSYIPGESPQPYRWSDDGVAEVGWLLGALHRATASFVPPDGAVWQEWFGRYLAGSDPVISHCDPGPWNIIARQGRPLAFVDWEFAGPVDGLWDVAHTAWLNAQLHDDDVAEKNGLGGPEDRARQLRLFVDGYGLDRGRRVDLVETMIELAIHSARDEAVRGRVTERSGVVDESGYPVLWAVTWRARSASWMLRHRSLLEKAVTA